MRRLSTHFTFQLSDLLVKLQALKKKAERRDRRELNNVRTRSSTTTNDSEDEDDNVFSQVQTPPPPRDNIQYRNEDPTAAHPIQFDSEPDKPTSAPARSPISRSLDDIISIVKNSHQGEPFNYKDTNIRIRSLEDSLKSISNLCTNISQKLDIVTDNSSTNSNRLLNLESRVDELDRNTKLYIDAKLNSVVNQIPKTSNELTHSSDLRIETLKKEVRSLKRKQLSDEHAISLISETIANVKDQVDSSLDESRSFSNNTTQFSRTRINRDNERNLMHDSIESIAKLIRQLIAGKVSIHSELSIIRKSNDDIKKVTAYIKTCQDSLMKYVTFDNFDNDLVSSVKALLDQANDWILHVEIIYSSSEAHAVSNSKGDISNAGIFTDNAEKTVYEFLDEIEIGLLGWGTSKQRAAQLYNRHLSEDIKSRTLDCSDNFTDIKRWLIKEFGSPSRIIGDVIADLRSKSKPIIEDVKSRYNFYSHLGKAIARLDKLIRVPSIDINDLESALYSRSTLNDLINILPTNDLNQLRRQMVKRKLDWKNPTGIVYFAFLKEFIDTEWDLLGPYKDIGNNTKLKSTHFTDSSLQSTFNVNIPPPSLPKVRKPWYQPGLRFPCPLKRHNHEMSDCKEFLAMHPKDRWEELDRFKICLTCLRPGDVCPTRPCTHYTSVPENLICQPCGVQAESRTPPLSPLNILLCRKKAHASSRAPPDQIHQQFSKYFGCSELIPQDIHIQFSVNFMYQAYSLNNAEHLTQQKLDLIDPPPL